ncbi:MAG: glycosyltransferase family 39 protein [Candidatus Aenigmarchaeota archaeon]|nr:glycosyltransferase family 39 protein [Candidatus Aenigmarchaeota archaeon]
MDETNGPAKTKQAFTKQALAMLRKHWYVIPLVAIFIFSFWIRSFPVKYGELTGLDEFYIYRISEYVVNHNLQLPEIDYMREYPLGHRPSQGEFVGTVYTPAIMYTIVKAFGVGTHYLYFALIYPAFMGALAAAIMFFVGKALYDNKAGLFSAFFLGAYPAFITRTAGGGIEKEAAVAPFWVLSMLFFILAYKNKSWKYGIASGIALMMISMTWGGVQYLYIIYGLFTLLLIFLNRDTGHLLRMFAPLALLGVIAPLAIFTRLPYLNPSVLLTEFVLGIIAIKYAVERFSLVKKENIRYIAPGICILALIAFLAGSLFIDELGGVLGGINTLVTGKQVNPIGFTVAENQPGSLAAIWQNMGYVFSPNLMPLITPIGQYFTLWVFMWLAIPLALYKLFRSKGKDMLSLLLLFMTTAGIWGVLFQIRLMFILAPAAALMAGYLLATLINASRRLRIMQNAATLKQKINYVTIIMAILVAVIVLVGAGEGYAFSNGITPIICFVQQNPPTQCITIDGNGDYHYAPNQPWYQALEFLAKETPPDSNILSWWDFGYWFQTRGLRNTVSDGGYGPRHENAYWFTANYTNWSAFEPLWRDKYSVDYIFMDYTLPGKYGAITAIATNGKKIDGFIQFGAQPVSSENRNNVTYLEFRSDTPYSLIIPTQNGASFADSPILYQSETPANRAYVNSVCTTGGIITIGDRTPSPGGCIAIRPIGIFYIPEDVMDTIFARLMFMEGAGLPVEKVFDNQVIQIYKVRWSGPENQTSSLIPVNTN